MLISQPHILKQHYLIFQQLKLHKLNNHVNCILDCYSRIYKVWVKCGFSQFLIRFFCLLKDVNVSFVLLCRCWLTFIFYNMLNLWDEVYRFNLCVCV